MQEETEGVGHNDGHAEHQMAGFDDNSSFRRPTSSSSSTAVPGSRESSRREEGVTRPSPTLFPSTPSFGYGGEQRPIVTLPPLASTSPSPSGPTSSVSYGSVIHPYNPSPPNYPVHPPIATLNTAPRSPPAPPPPQKKHKPSLPSMNTDHRPSYATPNPPTQSSSSNPSPSLSIAHTIDSNPNNSNNAGSSTGKDAASVKRTKTSRACDPCRRKKIRCDVIQNTEPPMCAHCKQYGFDCTFFLPITETRWKKRKLEEDAAQSPTVGEPGSSRMTPSNSSHPRADPTSAASTPITPSFPARRTSNETHPIPTHTPANAPAPTPALSQSNTRIYGPTSLTYILHSSSTMPAVDSFDLRYHQTWRVGRSGEGFIQVHEHGDLPEDGAAEQGQDERSRRPEAIGRETLEQLVNWYFKHIAPIFPVITEHEFLHGIGGSSSTEPTSPIQEDGAPAIPTYEPPLVILYAICTLAATSRHVPLAVFDSLRIMFNTVIRSEDVLSNASLPNIQALLISGMTAEIHGRVPSSSMSAAWLRVSAAIRMAQDLGLHRAEAVKEEIDVRRRLWSMCVICDRWYGLILGLPFMIDVVDCDVRVPVPDPKRQHQWTPEERTLAFTNQMVNLSLLMGKVSRTIYSPTGLIHTTDTQLETLLDSLDRFIDGIPSSFVCTGRDSDVYSGLIHMFHTCVCMMFWRVFARIQYTIPTHLRFALTVERWSNLTVESAKDIEWLAANEELYDSWLLVAYAITSCALVQYHTWARRGDSEAQGKLKLVRDCVKRWDDAVDKAHMLTRRKTTEIVSLLYEATLTPVPRNFWPLNPTAGVEARNSASADAIMFRKDPSRPGGGLFIATQRTASALGADMPDGTLVVEDLVPVSDGSGNDEAEEARASGSGSSGAGAGPSMSTSSSMNSNLSTGGAAANGETPRSAVEGPSHYLGDGDVTMVDSPTVVSGYSAAGTPASTAAMATPSQGHSSYSTPRTSVAMMAGPSSSSMGAGSAGAGPSSSAGGSGSSYPHYAGPNPLVPQTIPLLDGDRRLNNVNPQMNEGEGTQYGVNMLNTLDQPGPPPYHGTVNSEIVDRTPDGMFAWNQWDDYFKHIKGSGNGNGNGMPPSTSGSYPPEEYYRPNRAGPSSSGPPSSRQ